MTKPLIALACALALSAPAFAQEEPKGAPSPGEIVAQAPAAEWSAIAPENLLVMTLAPDRDGKPRQVVMQLMPAPFSQGWVENIRTLARAEWYDGIAVVRVQDNYVVQWGDPNGEDPAKAKALPEGVNIPAEAGYENPYDSGLVTRVSLGLGWTDPKNPTYNVSWLANEVAPINTNDAYADGITFSGGFPLGVEVPPFSNDTPKISKMWPVHCYGMVGVGRGYSPDTGTGAELYTVIGHAPRHLDRNIALVGRVVEGIEHLSSLPRGTGPLGFYEDPAQRVPIVSIRVAADLPASEQPRFQYLSTEGETFARYADARANRRDPFFIVPAGGADICNIPVPVRRAPG